MNNILHHRFALHCVSILCAGTTALRAQTFGPAPRDYHAMAYDSVRGVTVLFGGTQGAPLGDTWEWDGTSWALRSTTGPSPRYEHAMAYDSARARVVLFGGFGNSRYGDTWEWDGANWVLRATIGPAPHSQRRCNSAHRQHHRV